MRLLVATGLASRTGRRPDNQDFCAVAELRAAEQGWHGVLAVLADGMGGAKGGRIAAELACRSFIDAYLCQPETLGIAVCADRALGSYNTWLHAMATTDARMAGAATTFAALVLRGRQAHALHCGDSRLWHFRDGVLSLLTQDHCLPHPDQRHVLYRAVGLEPTVRLDHTIQPLAVHDRLLATSDGVHGSLSEAALARLLAARGSPGRDAAAIVEAALAADASDNVSAIVLDVVSLPEPGSDDFAATAASLPVLPPPRSGDTVDAMRIGRMLADTQYSRLFLATAPDGLTCVLKFPKPTALSQEGARAAFVREMLIGARIHSPYIAEVFALPAERQSRLYVASRFYDGQTLAARLARGSMPVASGVAIAIAAARGVVALHRRGIIHRDIKPDNLILPTTGTPRLIDLGVARLPQLEAVAAGEIPGTPGFMAPEMYSGEAGNQATDQFALGATLFVMFTALPPLRRDRAV